jgi:hypothetical protein
VEQLGDRRDVVEDDSALIRAPGAVWNRSREVNDVRHATGQAPPHGGQTQVAVHPLDARLVVPARAQTPRDGNDARVAGVAPDERHHPGAEETAGAGHHDDILIRHVARL